MKIIVFAVGTVVFVADLISRYSLKRTLENADWSVLNERGNNKTE